MFLEHQFGPLTEPVTGRHWDQRTVAERWRSRIAFFAAKGLAPGDRVFLHHGNTLEFLVDLAAIWSLGGCVVPVDSRLTGFEIETLARAASPRFSLWLGRPEPLLTERLQSLGVELIDVGEVGTEAPLPGVSALPPVDLDRDALILFTSGTTGDPKGVVHTHRTLQARWGALRQFLGIEPFRRTLCLLPTHFGHGLICNCLFPWLSGQHLFLLPPFKADLIADLGRLLDEHRISFLSSVPAVWRLALKTARPPQAPTLERVFCGSAPFSGHLWEQIRSWTGTPNVWNAYGITETGSWLAGTSVPGFTPEDGLVGEAWGGEIRILRSGDPGAPLGPDLRCAPDESGHVWVKTPALMRGYFGRDDLTAAVVSGGWFLTGDIGALDQRGWLYLRGREREEINKGGMKVYPGDVDAVAERFEQTGDVCTFALDDALLGQDVGIALVLSDSTDETVRRLYDWMAHHLAKHQMPAKWYRVDEIPRTSRGKINRAMVASRCRELTPIDMRGVLRRRGSGPGGA
jgi:acyl-CoA synthetase (AMP-forming)/AMP-acid ligase II